ncbi:hypothetical protein [Novosphingobium ginsenosidimutans]|uniref:AcrB/AcrD/AcrF family protein n=1 Tax=Novosphingobium ginsenosidimutans TaxID=1176536 RepID=A0A5B8S4C5_9SPHN|nr:hypothetical protein [Novosphingobium ginsenosidimutans]QEA15557.1 hypothetical protein FRF71_05075 [Novosphingobium ginsenosidimutans]
MLRAELAKEGPPALALVLVIWAAWALFRLALLPLTGTQLPDPDDYMRLLEVRDLLHGQAWFDVTQYRMGPPDGASMHWSRLIDLPLAGLILLFDTVLPRSQAELAAMALVPLLWLLPALLALRDMANSLSLPRPAALLTLVLFPLFPLLPGNFAPLRIDHHTAQSVAALVCGALLLRTGSRLAAVACGLVGAAWAVVSLEALPLLAALAGLYGLRWALARDRSLPWYLGALGAAAVLLSLATRPLTELTGPHCDILRPGHVAAFFVAALAALVLPWLPGKDSLRGRLLGVGLVPLAAIPAALAGLGRCAANPFGQLDPLLQTWWYTFVLEGRPIWQQPLSMAFTLVWTIAVIAAGWRLARRLRLPADRWNLLTGYALAAGLYSLLVMREGLAAQLLAIPAAALLLVHWLPRARAIPAALPRIAATLAVIALCTPTFGSAALKPFDQAAGSSAAVRTDPALGTCDYASLNRLPRGHLFAPLDRGPEILVRTGHTVVSGPYHRNQTRMVDVIAAFTGDPSDAAAIVHRNGATHVVACLSSSEIPTYGQARADNLANLIAHGRPPAWLVPVPGFETGALRVYAVR